MRSNIDGLRNRLSKLMPNFDMRAHPEVNLKISDRLNQARLAFIQGFHHALNDSPEMLAGFLEDLPYQKRGFSIEGAAMALVILDELGNSPNEFLSSLLTSSTESEKVLCAIGAGLASARLRKPYYWLPPHLGSKYKEWVYDGYGFHEGFFRRYRFNHRRSSTKTDGYNSFHFVGLGRSFWFIYQGQVKLIYKKINLFSQCMRKYLWQGVGTACAFTGNEEFTDELLRSSTGFESNLVLGLRKGVQLTHALAGLTNK